MADVELDRLVARVDGDTSGLNTAVTKSNAILGKLAFAAGSAGGTIASELLSTVGIATVKFASLGAAIAGTVGFLKSAAFESANVQVQIARLDAQIAATGMAAGVTAEEIDTLANQLNKTSLVSDDAIRQMAGSLLRFRSITGATFKEAIRLSIDLGEVMGSPTAAAFALGRALEDPARGTTALRRAGVIFTTTEREKIKALQEAGDKAGAQALVLDKLRTSVQGVAEATKGKSGLVGAMHDLSEAWSDLRQAVGDKGVQSAVSSFVSGTTENINRLTDAITGEVPIERLKARREKLREMLATDTVPVLIGGTEAARQKAQEELDMLDARLGKEEKILAFEQTAADIREWVAEREAALAAREDKAAGEELKKQEKAQKDEQKRIESLKDLTSGLESKLRATRLSEFGQLAFQLSTLKATEAEMQYALSLQASVDELQRLEEEQQKQEERSKRLGSTFGRAFGSGQTLGGGFSKDTARVGTVEGKFHIPLLEKTNQILQRIEKEFKTRGTLDSVARTV